jgi:hypothetical protein
VYEDVASGLQQLIDAADGVLEKTDPETIEETVQTAGVTPVDTALEAVGAAAGAVTAVLSLLSAHRTLSSAAVTSSDLAAVAVAGAIRRPADARCLAAPALDGGGVSFSRPRPAADGLDSPLSQIWHSVR